MRWQLTAVGVLCLLSACATVRTVYDEQGNVVKEHDGGERDFADYMEEKFNSSFSEKKTEQGIPQAVSNKVSSFQSKLDNSERIDKAFVTGDYAGVGESSLGGRSYSGADKSYSMSGRYSSEEKRLDRQLHPAFATGSRGIYGEDDVYADAREQAAVSGKKSGMEGEFYTKETPYYSRSEESGYIETRRDNTPPPRVYSKDEYMGKTIDDVRTMLGRDDEPES